MLTHPTLCAHAGPKFWGPIHTLRQGVDSRPPFLTTSLPLSIGQTLPHASSLFGVPHPSSFPSEPFAVIAPLPSVLNCWSGGCPPIAIAVAARDPPDYSAFVSICSLPGTDSSTSQNERPNIVVLATALRLGILGAGMLERVVCCPVLTPGQFYPVPLHSLSKEKSK